MKPFFFDGEIAASKSILNRLLVIQSFSRELIVEGDSRCDDVVKMRSALPAVLRAQGEPADCGAAGTTFRFLALRASRLPGRHLLTGSEKLLARPQGALIKMIEALGVRATLSSRGLAIEGDGWKKPLRPLEVDRSKSSQFASAALLSAWDLDFELELELSQVEGAPSEGYLEMTEALVENAGMQLHRDGARLVVPRSQVTASKLRAETDLSSAFAVAALAVASRGEARIHSFPNASLQPDSVYPEILRAMGADVRGDTVHGVRELRAIRWSLRDCPDLFPVLSVLCALAPGRSVLHGAPHLAHKESSRIETTAELLRGIGAKFELREDGIEIEGGAEFSRAAWDFDPKHDHRLAMAAAVAQVAGAGVRILHPEVVDKSFPEFWSILERGLR